MIHPPVTIEETAEAMAELMNGTDPSLLHALRAAALSPRVKLMCNAGYATALCPYRDVPLPPREILIETLSRAIRTDGSGLNAWGLMDMHVKTLLAIDEFWFGRGGPQDLKGSEIAYDFGYTLDSQRAWRCRMNSLVFGMGFKSLSWALFIYTPDHCQLLTLDSWHAKRLRVVQSSLARDSELSHSLYEQVETQVIAEVSELYPGVMPTVGAACEWYRIRGTGAESHAGLNCRITEESIDLEGE